MQMSKGMASENDLEWPVGRKKMLSALLQAKSASKNVLRVILTSGTRLSFHIFPPTFLT